MVSYRQYNFRFIANADCVHRANFSEKSGVSFDNYPNVKAWLELIRKREAVQEGLKNPPGSL